MTEIPQGVDDRPKEVYLSRYIRTHLCATYHDNSHAWLDLGAKLLPDAETHLSMISQNHQGVEEKWSLLLQLWLQRKPDASWKQLINALKEINLNHLAAQIEGMLMPTVDTATGSKELVTSTQDGASCVTLNQTLLSNNQLKAEFARLTMKICRILSESPDWKENLEISKHLLEFFPAKDNPSSLMSSAENIARIRNFKELFCYVFPYICWDEYSLLTGIVDTCDSEEAKLELHKYQRKMAIFQALEIISSTNSNLPAGFEKYCIILDKPYARLTIEKFEEIKKFIFENLDVHRYEAMNFIKVLYG